MNLDELLDRAIEDMETGKKRPKALDKVVPIYDHDYSILPDRIRVSFSDGKTAVYDIHLTQPSPVIIQNIKLIRKMKQGYVNQPMRRRRKA